jgi:hypothetical protein
MGNTNIFLKFAENSLVFRKYGKKLKYNLLLNSKKKINIKDLN